MTPEEKDEFSARLQTEAEGLTVLPSEQEELDETEMADLQPEPVSTAPAAPAPTGDKTAEAKPIPESKDSKKTEYSGQTVDYNGKQVPIEDVEYVSNIFGQKIPFLKKDKAKEELQSYREERNTRIGDMNEQVRQRMSAPGQGLIDTVGYI